jgi:hypothetical protein
MFRGLKVSRPFIVNILFVLHKWGSRPLHPDDELRVTIHTMDYSSQKLNQQYHLYVAESSKILAIQEQPIYTPKLPYPERSEEPVTLFYGLTYL